MLNQAPHHPSLCAFLSLHTWYITKPFTGQTLARNPLLTSFFHTAQNWKETLMD